MSLPSEVTTKRTPQLGIVETIYHRLPGQQPIAWESRYLRNLHYSDETPYQRRLKLTDQTWVMVDTGWIQQDNCSMLYIKNLGGVSLNVKPTEEQKQDIASRIINIGVVIATYPNNGGEDVKHIATINVGETLRLSPVNLWDFRLNCNCKDTVALIIAIPK